MRSLESMDSWDGDSRFSRLKSLGSPMSDGSEAHQMLASRVQVIGASGTINQAETPLLHSKIHLLGREPRLASFPCQIGLGISEIHGTMESPRRELKP